MKTIGAVQAKANSEIYALADGAIGTDTVVVVNDDATVSVIAGGVSLTAENYIGISDAAYADGAVATIQTSGSLNTGQSSLTSGQTYFVQTDGTIGLSADDPSVIAGTAVSATDIIVKG